MTDLRSEIMSSYTCILQGMNDSQRQSNLVPYIQSIFDVIQTVVIKEMKRLMQDSARISLEMREVCFGKSHPLTLRARAKVLVRGGKR